MLVHHTFWGASTRADRTQRNAGRPRWFSHPTLVTLADMSYESSQLWAVDSVPLDLPPIAGLSVAGDTQPMNLKQLEPAHHQPRQAGHVVANDLLRRLASPEPSTAAAEPAAHAIARGTRGS